MKRPRTFIALEVAVLAVVEGVNAVAIAPLTPPHRIATGLFLLAYVAYGFLIPASPRGRTWRLAGDGLLLAAIASFSGLAVGVAVLLVSRALELKPNDLRVFIAASLWAAACFLASVWVGIYVEHRPAEVIALVTLPLLYTLGIALIIAERNVHESRAALEAANVELALHAARSEEIGSLTERYRIARALQEDIERGLSTIGEQLESAVERRGADPGAADLLTFRAQRTAAFTLAALRRTVSEMRADSLAHGGIAAALRDLCRAFAASTSRLTVEARIAEVEVDDPAVVAGLERIAREALINVVRHGEASSATLSFEKDEGGLVLVVSDNGASGESGLETLRARAKAVGATCEISCSPEGGTTVRVTVPRST